jgi:Icc protein
LQLIQISDCHLEGEAGGRLLGLDTDRSLGDVMALLEQRPSPAQVLVTGDIAAEGNSAAYARFRSRYLSRLTAPIACLPGNHDEPQALAQMLDGLLTKRIALGNWQLLLLDSRIDGSECGALAEAEMAWLARTLAADTHLHTLIFLHHQVLPVGCTWLDRHAVRNGAALRALLASHPQVRGVSSGHVHQASEQTVDGVRWLTSPSTCIQFLPASAGFALDTAMPGYRWFSLYADGRFETGVERVSARDYGIDMTSGGY